MVNIDRSLLISVKITMTKSSVTTASTPSGSPHPIAIVILAAGQSQRFSGCKVLATIDGKPMLQWAIEKARACVGEHVFVVSGGWQQDIKNAVSQGQIETVDLIENCDWRSGIGHSIACAVQKLRNRYDQLLFLAADQVAVTASDLKNLLQQAEGGRIIAAHYKGQPGIPAIFPKRYFENLSQLTGDRGAKKILMTHPQAVKALDCPNAAIDIDTQGDLYNWCNGMQSSDIGLPPP